MKRTILTITIALIATYIYGNTLEQNKEIYRNGIAKIEANTVIKDKLDKAYSSGLDSLINTYKSQANFDAVKTLIVEKNRFELEKTSGESISYCKDLQTKYEEQLVQYEISKIKEKLDFSRRYMLSLKHLLANSMKQNQMTEAEEINLEIKSIEFVIADLLTQLPESKPSHPKDAIQFGNHYYKAFKDKVTWHEANEKCKGMGGYLVCITSKMENDFVKTKLPFDNCWIGLYEEANKPNEWKLVNGDKFTYNDFGTYPHRGNFARFGLYKNKWMWVAVPYNNEWGEGYICEWDE